MVVGEPGSNEAEDQIGDACWASTLAWRQADCKPVGNDGDGQDMETQKVQQRVFFSSPICSPKKKEGDKACKDEEKPERSREGSEPASPHWDRLTSILVIMIGF